MVVKIDVADRHILIPLIENCQYFRVLIDTVLEGFLGCAYADSVNQPRAARLDSGTFTMLGGDPFAVGVKDLVHIALIYYVTPQGSEWRGFLQSEFGDCISKLSFTDFSSVSLGLTYLANLFRAIPLAFELDQINRPLADQLPSDIGNEYFFENFYSVDDFLERGISYCILDQNKIFSAATSTARSSMAIDIEIETVAAFRKQGLGTVVGAKLVSHCSEQGIDPPWLAANAVSEKLALKLGYIWRETYETYAIQ